MLNNELLDMNTTSSIAIIGPATDLQMTQHVDQIIYCISKEEIKKQNIQPMIKRLNAMLSPSVAQRFFEKIDMCIDGYNNDRRDLWQIPEVRKYIARLDEEFPYWFYYADTSKPFPLFTTITFCLCNFEKEGREYALLKDDLFEAFIRRNWAGMTVLCQHTGFTDEEIRVHGDKIISYYT